MLDKGSKIWEFRDSPESGWDIVNYLINQPIINNPESPFQNDEFLELQRRLDETEARVSDLQMALASQKEIVRALREDAQVHNDEMRVKQLNSQLDVVENQIQEAFERVKEMKIPFFKRLFLQFTGWGVRRG